MQETAAAFDVHIKEDDQQCFGNGNSHREDKIEQAKIDIANAPGQSEQQHERDADFPVQLRRMSGRFHLAVSNQIEQREKKNPDDIDKVPV